MVDGKKTTKTTRFASSKSGDLAGKGKGKGKGKSESNVVVRSPHTPVTYTPKIIKKPPFQKPNLQTANFFSLAGQPSKAPETSLQERDWEEEEEVPPPPPVDPLKGLSGLKKHLMSVPPTLQFTYASVTAGSYLKGQPRTIITNAALSLQPKPRPPVRKKSPEPDTAAPSTSSTTRTPSPYDSFRKFPGGNRTPPHIALPFNNTPPVKPKRSRSPPVEPKNLQPQDSKLTQPKPDQDQQLTANSPIKMASYDSQPTPPGNHGAVSLASIDKYKTPVIESSYASPRLQEREELQVLNSRLSSYIRHIRELKEGNSLVDSEVFMKSVQLLEDELMNMKKLYEDELNNLRTELDDISRSRNHFALEEQKAKAVISDLKSRLERENDRNHKLTVEINSLNRRIINKDNELQQLQVDFKQPLAQIDTLQREYQDMLRDFGDIKKRFEMEQLARQEAEGRADSSQKKLDFQITMFEQKTEKSELQERLQGATFTIRTLEEKLRELHRHDQILTEMLARVRNNTEIEIKRYQEETEARHGRHLAELKAQIDEDDKRISELNDETIRLNTQITNLIGTIRNLEGDVGGLSHIKSCLENDLRNEKLRGHDFALQAQSKLRQMQDILVNKMRELNAAREAQIPLKAEIESYKTLLEAEERRLQIGPIEFPEIPAIPSAKPTPAYIDAKLPKPIGPIQVPTASGYGNCNVVPSSHSHSRTSPDYQYGRGHSAPAGPSATRRSPVPPPTREHKLPLVPANCGKGRNYYDEMYRDLKLRETVRDIDYEYRRGPTMISKEEKPKEPYNIQKESFCSDNMQNGEADPQANGFSKMDVSPVGHPLLHNPHLVAGATGDVTLSAIAPNGDYVQIYNMSKKEGYEIGSYTVQQNVAGQPVAVYRFPPDLYIGPQQVITVWAGGNSGTDNSERHRPPTDFLFAEQQHWGTGPDCTTILCRPSGQAVAWCTPTRVAYLGSTKAKPPAAQKNNKPENSNKDEEVSQESDEDVDNPSPPKGVAAKDVSPVKPKVILGGAPVNRNGQPRGYSDISDDDDMEPELPQYDMNINAPRPEPMYLRRVKEQPPSFAPPKHPHGLPPDNPVHPSYGLNRVKTYGNDNSTMNRQSRSQSNRPDPIPGAPYAGPAGQRMGSASLRAYYPTSVPAGNKLANRSAQSQMHGPPTPFYSYKQQCLAKKVEESKTK